MGMSSQSGTSNTTSTQPYIMSGPSVYAANMAADAQVQAAQDAANAVTQNTTSAINALMNQYSTALTYANPTINTGNQAAAQMNYMLGLPAVNPGAAPIKPTLQSEEANITPGSVYSQIQQGLNYSTQVDNGKGNLGGSQGAANGGSINQAVNSTASYIDPITGAVVSELTPGSLNNGTWGYGGGINAAQFIAQASAPNQYYANDPSKGLNGGVKVAGGNTPGAGGQQGTLYQDTLQSMAQPVLNQDLKSYNQQNAQWQQQEDLYNKYNAMGQATPSTISSIVSNLPGFQFSQNQGINAIQNAASASGMLNSGNLLEQLNQFGQGLSEQYYNNYMNQLGQLAGLGQQATGQAINASNSLGQQVAGQYGNQGSAQANAALSAGQAMASSYLTPVANQQVAMYPYTTSSTTNSSSNSFSGNGMLSALGSLSSFL